MNATPQPTEAKPVTTKPKRVGKTDKVLKLLKVGVTLDELKEVTGWQAHSVRGFISTLRKKQNLNILNIKDQLGRKVYKIQ